MSRQLSKYDIIMIKCNKCSRYVSTNVDAQIQHNKQWHPVHVLVTKEEKERARHLLNAWEDMLLYHNGLTAHQLHEICSSIIVLRTITKGNG